MNLTDFSLLKEDSDSYHVGHPSGKKLVVSKSGLSSKAQKLVAKLKPMKAAEGAMVPDEEADGQIAENISAAPRNINVEPAQINAGMPSPTPEMQTGGSGGSWEPAPQQAPSEMSPQPQASANPQAMPFEEEKQAEQAKGEALSKQGIQESKAISDVEDKISKMPTQQDIIAANKKKDDELLQAYNDKKIDPDRYLHNMSTGSRIVAGLAMILGGAGAGVTHTSNPAVDAINNAIERDIQSQREDKSSAMNLWKMNKENLGTELQANLATQNQLYTGLKYKLMAAASNAMSPLAKAAAQQGMALIDQKLMVNNIKQAALTPANRTEAEQVQNMNQMRMVDPAVAKELEDKYIPGVGTTRVPVTKENREAFASYDSLGKAIDDAKGFANKEGTTVPGTSKNAEAASKRTAIILELNKLHGLNRLNDHEFTSYTDQVPDPGAWNTEKAKARLDELQRQINTHRQSESTAIGLTPFKTAPHDMQAVQWAKQNPNDPRAQQILKVNGK